MLTLANWYKSWFTLWPAFSALIVFLSGVAALHYPSWKKNRIAKRITTHLGYVKLTPKDILSFRASKDSPLPENLEVVIRKLSARDLARLSVDGIYGGEKQTGDLRRAVTVAAALYGFAVPHRCILLDGDTASFYRHVVNALQLVYVSPVKPPDVQIDSAIIAGSDTLTDMSMARFTSQLHIIAATLIHFAHQGGYPMFRVYVETLNLNLKQGLKGMYSDEEIRSMISAYAALSFTRIPRSYAASDARTYAIINRIQATTKRPSLTLVK